MERRCAAFLDRRLLKKRKNYKRAYSAPCLYWDGGNLRLGSPVLAVLMADSKWLGMWRVWMNGTLSD